MKWVKDPVFLRRFHGWATLFFLILGPVSWWLDWLSSVEFVAYLSLWALVASHWAAWQSSRVEVKQDEQNGAGP